MKNNVAMDSPVVIVNLVDAGGGGNGDDDCPMDLGDDFSSGVKVSMKLAKTTFFSTIDYSTNNFSADRRGHRCGLNGAAAQHRPTERQTGQSAF
uniref:Uncharacterized protein n=1 Tax=Romanomermis culicivorax TaxID=13658 RepID=A0A915J5F9_ROMCU